MNTDELKKGAAEAGQNVVTAANSAGVWAKTHPEIMKILAYIAAGIAIGYILFAGK